MNGAASDPAPIGAFILSSPMLHARFSAAIELLARLVIATPRPLTVTSLADACEQSPRMARSLLNGLCRSGLVFRHETVRDAWYCSASLGMITLADVFRSISATMPESMAARRGKADEAAADIGRSAAQQSVDLLLMQATMAINQVVLQHLQAFDLARLKAVGASADFAVFDARRRSFVAEPF